MKPLNRITAILFLLFLNFSCAVQQKQASYAQPESVNFQVFYDKLSPYGQWVDYPNYGYVWLPDAEQNFAPYSTDGYWVNTEYGWTWVSDYKWGWAPFHYGRWDFDNYYGWFWVPDNQWGPSWVNWRSGNGYYGWAPMRPGMNNNIGYNEGNRDFNRWNFVHDRDFGRSDIHRHYVDRREYTTIINNTTVINNTYIDKSRNTTYIAGPPKDNVQRATGRKINSVAIRDSNRPEVRMSNNQLQIYRPQVQPNGGIGQGAAPSRITKLEEVKSTRARNVTNPQNNVTPGTNTRDQQQTQPGRQVERRRQERQSPQRENQNQQRQQTQPTQTQPQQPKVTPQPQQNERRRQERQDQQSQQTQPAQPQVTPQLQQQQQLENERRRQEVQQQQIQQQQIEKQNQQKQAVQPVQPQSQSHSQVAPQIEKQQPQQSRRQERQQVRQQQSERQNQQNQRTQPVETKVQEQPQVTPQQPQQTEQQPQRRRQER